MANTKKNSQSSHFEQVELEIEGKPANGPGSGYGAAPAVWDSSYIFACHESRWKLATWQVGTPDVVTFRPARCCSWRHAGPCRQKKGQEDYARISEALTAHDRSHVSYMVLTVDPSGWTAQGHTGGTARRKEAIFDLGARNQAYGELVSCWQMLCQSMRRRFGDLHYVCTVECHKSGWPHLNLIIVCEALTAEIQGASNAFSNCTRQYRGRKTCEVVLGRDIVAAGFGKIGFAEVAAPLEGDGGDRLAGYIAKLAGQAEEGFLGETATGLVDSFDSNLVAEIIKASQVPTMAPKGFRRLRSSKGFLPKVKRDENLTGAIFDEGGKRIGARRSASFVAAIWNSTSVEAIKMAQRLVGEHQEKERSRGSENKEDYFAFGVLATWKQVSAGTVPWGEGELGRAVAAICEPYRPRGAENPVKAIDPAGQRAVNIDDVREVFEGYDGPGFKVARKIKLNPDLRYTPPPRTRASSCDEASPQPEAAAVAQLPPARAPVCIDPREPRAAKSRDISRSPACMAPPEPPHIRRKGRQE